MTIVNPAQIFSIGDVCSIVGSIPHTVAGFVWTGITTLGLLYSSLIVLGIVVWVALEIITRNGDFHYNSDNGFSPLFNVFVGSGINFGLHELLGLGLAKMFGSAIYCVAWPYVLHLVIFIATGLFLRSIEFWTYLRILGERPRKRGRQWR